MDEAGKHASFPSTSDDTNAADANVTASTASPLKSASGRTRIQRSESMASELPTTEPLAYLAPSRVNGFATMRRRRPPSRVQSTKELEDRRRTLIERGEIVDKSVVVSPLTEEDEPTSPRTSASSSVADADDSPKPKGVPKGAVKMGMGMMPGFDPSAVKLRSTKK